METTTTGRRPRVAGEREGDILDATVSVLCEVGYDRLTMDQVAALAKASKATLYRRWDSKAELVIDAVVRAKQMPAPELADTGSLRGDLMTAACGQSGWAEKIPMSALAGLLTAVNADPQLFRLWQERFLLPRMEWNRAVFERAIARGEIADDVNLDLLSTLIPSMCMFRAMVLGQPVDAAFVTAVIDGLLIPAVGPDPSSDRPCS
jgi:AcrR family transcriptional regulator